MSGVEFEVTAVFGFRKTIVDGTRKDSPLRSSLLETERWTIFYCNSHTAILNPQRTRETQFLRKLFARPAFSRKSGQYCVAMPKKEKFLVVVKIFSTFAPAYQPLIIGCGSRVRVKSCRIIGQ